MPEEGGRSRFRCAGRSPGVRGALAAIGGMGALGAAGAAALVSLMLAPAGCRRTAERITTPQEFVQACARAHREEDIDAIRSLSADLRELEDRGVSHEDRLVLDHQADSLLRGALKHGLAEGRSLYRSWSRAEYVEHVDHGDHIHVTIATMGARAGIVLVRQDGALRLHPQPSWFVCPPDPPVAGRTLSGRTSGAR